MSRVEGYENYATFGVAIYIANNSRALKATCNKVRALRKFWNEPLLKPNTEAECISRNLRDICDNEGEFVRLDLSEQLKRIYEHGTPDNVPEPWASFMRAGLAVVNWGEVAGMVINKEKEGAA